LSRETNDEMVRLAEWFGESTRVISVDTAIQAKDRFDFAERNRLKARAAHLLAAQLLENDLVATTVLQTDKGDVIRLQVQCVRPEVWCDSHDKVFSSPPPPSVNVSVADTSGMQMGD